MSNPILARLAAAEAKLELPQIEGPEFYERCQRDIQRIAEERKERKAKLAKQAAQQAEIRARVEEEEAAAAQAAGSLEPEQVEEMTRDVDIILGKDENTPEPLTCVQVMFPVQQVGLFDPSSLAALFPPLARAQAALAAEAPSQQAGQEEDEDNKASQAELAGVALRLQGSALLPPLLGAYENSSSGGSSGGQQCREQLFGAVVGAAVPGVARAAYDALLAAYGVDDWMCGPGMDLPLWGSAPAPGHTPPPPPTLQQFLAALRQLGYSPTSRSPPPSTSEPSPTPPLALHNLQLLLDLVRVLCTLRGAGRLQWQLQSESVTQLVTCLLHLMVDEVVGERLRLELQMALLQLLDCLEQELWAQVAGGVCRSVSQLSLPHRPFLSLLRCLSLEHPRCHWLLQQCCLLLLRAIVPPANLQQVRAPSRSPSAASQLSLKEVERLVGGAKPLAHALREDVWKLNSLLCALDLLVMSRLKAAGEESDGEVEEATLWLVEWSSALGRDKILMNQKSTQVVLVRSIIAEIESVYRALAPMLFVNASGTQE